VTASVSSDFQDGGFTKDLTFSVNVENGCSEDIIQFNNYITDSVYYLGVVTDEASGWEATTGKALAEWDVGVTHTEIGCPVTFTLLRMVGTETIELTTQ
jgi:hypothetical protein